MAKTRSVSVLSAIILFALAIIWLIYLCAGNNLGEQTTDILSGVVIIITCITIFSSADFLKDNTPGWLAFIIIFLALVPYLFSSVVLCCEAFGFDLLASFPPVVIQIIDIVHKVIYIILYVLLIINAWDFTDSAIFRIIFIVIGLFLIFCAVLPWIPPLAQNFKFPLIGFQV